MNFQQALFDELEKIGLGAGAYLPGGEASDWLAEAKGRAAAHRESLNVPIGVYTHRLHRGQPAYPHPGALIREERSHLAQQKKDWARQQGRVDAPSEVTGTRRLKGLDDPRLPGAPLSPKRDSGKIGQIAGKVESIAGRVGSGMRTGVGRIGQGIRSGVGRVGSFIRGMAR